MLMCRHCVHVKGSTDLHDQTSGGGIAPVIGILQAQDDVLTLLHLHAHHALHLLGAVLHDAVSPPWRC